MIDERLKKAEEAVAQMKVLVIRANHVSIEAIQTVREKIVELDKINQEATAVLAGLREAKAKDRAAFNACKENHEPVVTFARTGPGTRKESVFTRFVKFVFGRQ